MIARRYAKALLNISILESSGQEIKKEMQAVLGLIADRKYFSFLTNRMVTDKEKLAIFSDLSLLTREFLHLVIKSKREHMLPIMAREYIKLVNKHLNMEDVEVVTKDALALKEQQKLENAISKYIKKKVNLYYSTDKSVLGGVRIRYGNKTVDGTVSGVLLRLLDSMTRN